MIFITLEYHWYLVSPAGRRLQERTGDADRRTSAGRDLGKKSAVHRECAWGWPPAWTADRLTQTESRADSARRYSLIPWWSPFVGATNYPHYRPLVRRSTDALVKSVETWPPVSATSPRRLNTEPSMNVQFHRKHYHTESYISVQCHIIIKYRPWGNDKNLYIIMLCTIMDTQVSK